MSIKTGSVVDTVDQTLNQLNNLPLMTIDGTDVTSAKPIYVVSEAAYKFYQEYDTTLGTYDFANLGAKGIRLYADASSSTTYIDLKAPATIATSYIAVLPSTQPTANQVLAASADATVANQWDLQWSSVPTITTGSGTANRIAYWGSANTLSDFAAMTNGQLLVGATGLAPAVYSIPSTASITVTTGSGTLSFNTVQNIRVTDSPIFTGLNLSGLTASLPIQTDVSKNLVSAAIDLSGAQATGTIAAARMPAHTGDATSSAGAVALTLATVNSNVGSFGSSTAIPTFTVNGKGLITAASTAVVIAPAGTLSGGTLASNVLASSLTSVGTLATLTVTATITGAVSGTAANVTASSNSTLTTLSVLSLPATQLTGTIVAARMPALTGDVTTSAGAVATSLVATTNGTLTTLSVLSLPATQLSGTIVAARMPALTGDVTSTVNTVGTSLVATSNATLTTLSALTSLSSGSAITIGGSASSANHVINGTRASLIRSANTSPPIFAIVESDTTTILGYFGVARAAGTGLAGTIGASQAQLVGVNGLSFSGNNSAAHGNLDTSGAWTIGVAGSTAQILNGLAYTIYKDSATSVATQASQVWRISSTGTTASGFGGRREIEIQNTAGTVSNTAVWEQARWTTATAGVETSEWSIWTRTGGAAPTQNLTVDGAGAVTLGASSGTQAHVVNGTTLILSAGTFGSFVLQRSGSANLARFGIAGAANNYVTGSAAGDAIIRNDGGKFLFSADGSGSVIGGSMDTNAKWTLGASGGTQTHVVNGALTTSVTGSAIFGSTSGSVVAASYVGEVFRQAYAGGTVNTVTGNTAVDVTTFTLTAGVWVIHGHYDTAITTTATLGVGSSPAVSLLLTDNSNTVLEQSLSSITQLIATTVEYFVFPASFVHTVSVSASTTYKVRLLCNQTNTASLGTVYNNGANISNGATAGSYVTAVRIA